MKSLALLLALTLAAPAIAAEQLKGVILSFPDGDTYRLKCEDGRVIRVREWVADAPEVAHSKKQTDQPGAREALEYATKNWQAREVTVTVKGKSYDRIVGETTRPAMARTLGLDLVAAGFAWVYPQSRPRPPKEYAVAENKAKEKRLGIWNAKDKPLPPWEWRKKQRTRGR